MTVEAIGTEGERSLPTESIVVSDRLTVTAVHLDHKPHLLQSLTNEYSALMTTKSGAIFEYVPDKLRKMEGKPWVTLNPLVNFREILEYFSRLEKIAAASRRDIWCFDPAKCENFALVRAPQYGTAGLGLATMIAGICVDDTKITRREFLREVAAVGGLISVGSVIPIGLERTFDFPNPLYLEAEFRRITVAAGIRQLGRKLVEEKRPQQDFLFVTSIAQWEGVKNWLRGTAINSWWNSLLSACTHLDQSVRHDFFTALQYKYVGGVKQYEKFEFPLQPL